MPINIIIDKIINSGGRLVIFYSLIPTIMIDKFRFWHICITIFAIRHIFTSFII